MASLRTMKPIEHSIESSTDSRVPFSQQRVSLKRDLTPALAPTKQCHSLLDWDILDINDVASLLRCSVDTVRRIPREELPACEGPGRPKLYLREDILTYLRGRRVGVPQSTNVPPSSQGPTKHDFNRVLHEVLS